MIIKDILEIADTLECPFDYFAVVQACKLASVQIPSSHNYARTLGMALVGKCLAGETKTLYEAYLYHNEHIEISKEDDPNYVPEKSRGLGDTAAKVFHAIGADKVAEVYEKVTGKPCGCHEHDGIEGRKEKWNKLFPYKREQ